jgi:hypothetical protein
MSFLPFRHSRAQTASGAHIVRECGNPKKYLQTNKDNMKRIDILQLSFISFQLLYFKVISLDSRLRGNDINGYYCKPMKSAQNAFRHFRALLSFPRRRESKKTIQNMVNIA